MLLLFVFESARCFCLDLALQLEVLLLLMRRVFPHFTAHAGGVLALRPFGIDWLVWRSLRFALLPLKSAGLLSLLFGLAFAALDRMCLAPVDEPGGSDDDERDRHGDQDQVEVVCEEGAESENKLDVFRHVVVLSEGMSGTTTPAGRVIPEELERFERSMKWRRMCRQRW